ncbi:MAG: spondin domain-containing protein [Planctomycetota bacterium]|nr:spondin domain-containing protein [Planctomycetota bacterium]
MNRTTMSLTGVGIALLLAGTSHAEAGSVRLRVVAQNLSPANSLTFAPLRVGFGNGTYDSFNNGQAATAPIISIAEGGSGADWFPAFAAAEPNATLGTVVSAPPGPLLPGASASAEFDVDPSVNPFFTFGSMVVPSNDYFIGNDSPTQYRLFNAAGDLQLTTIEQRARDIWDAGSELDGAFGAAFLMGSNNDDRIPQNGVVGFDFEGLDVFNGLTTAAGFTFQRQVQANDLVYRISFEVVPAPGAATLMGLGMLGVVRRRR